MSSRSDIRLSVPSKGVLAETALNFLADCGLEVRKTNPRQYEARIPALPQLTVLFQRPADIVVSVADGSVDFGITGLDMVAERNPSDASQLLLLHDALDFGHCRLAIAIPEAWQNVSTLADLSQYLQALGRPVRVATKFPRLTAQYLQQHGIQPFSLITVEGTLEAAPAIGYADVIADLVSSGQTLRDNRLRPIADGTILRSQAVLLTNRETLRTRPEVLSLARVLLEYIEAHLRAVEHVAIYANIRGDSPRAIADKMFAQQTLGGLQGPTISPVVVRSDNGNWHAVHIIVRKDRLFQAISELRAIGGSGVVVTPVIYIFEEEPPRYRALMEAVHA
jgi:ATP phosphoribosyltransferase